MTKTKTKKKTLRMDNHEDLRAERKERLKFALSLVGGFGLALAIGFGIRYGLYFLSQNVSSKSGQVITFIAVFVGTFLLIMGLSRFCPNWCLGLHSNLVYFKQSICFYVSR